MRSSHQPYSLKKRLTYSTVLLCSLFGVISLCFTYLASHHEVLEVYDARLGQAAKVFAGNFPLYDVKSDGELERRWKKQDIPQLEDWIVQINALSETLGETTNFGHKYENRLLIQAYAVDKLVWSSIPSVGRLKHPTHFSGYGYSELNGEVWRYFLLKINVLSKSHGEYIIVAEKQSLRDEMMSELAFTATTPQLVLIPCIAIAMFLLINRLFAPITELKVAISVRNSNKLDKIHVKNQTTELSPLVEALNRLLQDLEDAWNRERQFTRMAAHELKTPLTILRLNAENALQATNPVDLKHDLGNILVGIDRSDRLIQQLLTLARVESIQSLHPTHVDIDAKIRSIITDLVPLALKNNQDISYEGIPATVEGDESLLRILFSNLVDNAIRYSGQGSMILVSITEDEAAYYIQVADSGSPIPLESRDKLFESFYRSNRDTGDGAGLGLAITRDIARLHGGDIEFLQKNVEYNTFSVSLMKFNG